MPTLRSAQPSPELCPYVRAYAQRKFDPNDLFVVEAVPAQLEQVLNFELGTMPGVHHRDHEISAVTWIGGAQTSFPGYMDLYPGTESFAIFFQPAGWSQLFAIPMREITNRIHDANLVMGACIRVLWNRLGESSSFEDRVAIVEQFLQARLARAVTQDRIAAAATYLFRRHGAVRIPRLARRDSMGLRQFERRFQQGIGASPKVFARVARFQAALDAKLASPGRSWLDIAHTFGYYDQMHMIHDFERLGRSTPTQIIAQLGDVRPPALASADAHTK
jgi:AraC-like DNA-binding protein